MDIRSYLKCSGRPLLFDGAMGTYYNTLTGLPSGQCERANLDRPEEILAIHRGYLSSGCQAIKTNTFSMGAELADGDEALAMQIIRRAAVWPRRRRSHTVPMCSRTWGRCLWGKASARRRATAVRRRSFFPRGSLTSWRRPCPRMRGSRSLPGT